MIKSIEAILRVRVYAQYIRRGKELSCGIYSKVIVWVGRIYSLGGTYTVG
jgi:hypothetical protein